MFASAVYVKIYKDRFWARHIQSGTTSEVRPARQVSTSRMLIGDFTTADKTLKELVSKVAKRGLFSVSPEVLIQPMEMNEGGLSQVEERLLPELAYGSGARKAKVYDGIELSDDGVLNRLSGK